MKSLFTLGALLWRSHVLAAPSKVEIAGAESKLVFDQGTSTELIVSSKLFRNHIPRGHMNDLFASGCTCKEIWDKGQNHAITTTSGWTSNEYLLNPTGHDLFMAHCAEPGRTLLESWTNGARTTGVRKLTNNQMWALMARSKKLIHRVQIQGTWYEQSWDLFNGWNQVPTSESRQTLIHGGWYGHGDRQPLPEDSSTGFRMTELEFGRSNNYCRGNTATYCLSAEMKAANGGASHGSFGTFEYLVEGLADEDYYYV